MIKVLFVTNSLGYGGASKILTFVANNLDKNRFRAAIYNLSTSPTVQKVDNDILIFDDETRNIRIIRRFIQVISIMKKIYSYKPDIIISFLDTPSFLSVIAGKLTRIPVIFSERGDPYKRNTFSSKIYHYIISHAAGAVFQTNAAKEYYPKRLQEKSRVVLNPAIIKDESLEANLDSPANEISFVGRFENVQKRQDIMIEAFKIVSEKYPDYVLKFYGKGQDEDYIKGLAEASGLKNKILFMGYTSNPTKDISNSRMLVLTSDYEGIPNALIEAMSIGLPVVSTDCSPGGARMLIENEVNGLLVNTGDPMAVAKAITKYIGNPDLAKRCGTAARKIKDKFLPDVIIKQWEDYINLVAGRGKWI